MRHSHPARRLVGPRLVGLVLMLLLAGMALPRPGMAGDEGITRTIERQLDAFMRDDFAAAFEFASPAIQGLFRTPENFGLMVQTGYPMVWRHASVRYLDLREEAGALWQRVEITDAAGRVHLLDYQMVRGANGWRINGVQVLRAPEAGA